MSNAEILSIIGQQATKSFIESSIAPVLITAVVTALGAWLTFRGKTQDTANWLIEALRLDAKEARSAAVEALAKSAACELHREEDQRTIAYMQRRLGDLEDEQERWRREGPPSGDVPLTG